MLCNFFLFHPLQQIYFVSQEFNYFFFIPKKSDIKYILFDIFYTFFVTRKINHTVSIQKIQPGNKQTKVISTINFRQTKLFVQMHVISLLQHLPRYENPHIYINSYYGYIYLLYSLYPTILLITNKLSLSFYSYFPLLTLTY